MVKVKCTRDTCEHNYYGFCSREKIDVVDVELEPNEFAPICASVEE